MECGAAAAWLTKNKKLITQMIDQRNEILFPVNS
jgi:hypothetical protein